MGVRRRRHQCGGLLTESLERDLRRPSKKLLNKWDYYGRLALSWTAINGHERKVHSLLACGIQPDMPD